MYEGESTTPLPRPDVASMQDRELEPREERVLELREEQLVANREVRELAEVVVRTEVDVVPAQLEVDSWREEVEVVHEPVGESVSKRVNPWEEDGDIIVPIYEEQLVVTKRLILRERLRVKRVNTSERRLFQDNVKRERLVIEDPTQTGLVHEVYASEDGKPDAEHDAVDAPGREPEHSEGNFLSRIGRKVLE